MRLCTQCILPETFPGITFDDAGVCTFCRQYEGWEGKHQEDKARYAEKFAELLRATCVPDQAGQRAHDVLMAYSGGKDSTYTLLLLKRKYGLRVLAVSFDNGFISPRALQNIKAVVEEVGVDHVLFKPRWDLLRKIFAAAAGQELYPKKTLERASTICTSCIGLVKATCLKMAVEQGIPMIGFGWSPGQAPVQSSIMRNNPSLIRMTQATLLNPMKSVAGDEVAAYFLGERHFAHPERFPWNVHPLAWEHYDEQAIVAEIGALGWVSPEDTDPNSTNCLLNAYANEVHVGRYGFHPYIWEIANMVREGVMSREEGMEKFSATVPAVLVEQTKARLGV